MGTVEMGRRVGKWYRKVSTRTDAGEDRALTKRTGEATTSESVTVVKMCVTLITLCGLREYTKGDGWVKTCSEEGIAATDSSNSEALDQESGMLRMSYSSMRFALCCPGSPAVPSDPPRPPLHVLFRPRPHPAQQEGRCEWFFER